ncbi:MAG: hypothetical protein F6K19_10260 [Cyanothece sp. SIO1E1]|nr:hypothetical protein [Cyanothece sp. SIO1E1]
MNLNVIIKSLNHQTKATGWQQWLPIAAVLVLAAILFFYRIEAEGLWIDELSSINDAQEPSKLYTKNLLRPLYYALLMAWMSLGNSDAWLRSLSVIFAIISVFLLYRLGRRLFGEVEGLISALLLALSPMFINHAQEIRMYALSACLGLGGTLCLANVLLTEKPKAPGNAPMAGWFILRLLAMLTVPLNVTLLLPDVLLVWLRFRQQRASLFNFGKWLLVLLLLWSPCVLAVIQFASPTSEHAAHHVGRTPPGLDNVVRTLKFWTVWPFAVQANAIAATFYKLFTFMLAGLISLTLFQRHKSPQLLWVAAWFALPLVPIFAFSYISIPLWVNRYLLFVSPYLFILLAFAISRLWQQWRVAALVVGITYLIAVSGGLVRYYTVQDRPDYKFIIQTIEQYEQPGDTIVWSRYYTKPLSWYYQGTAEVHVNPTIKVKSDLEISQWLDQFPTPLSRLWLVLKVNEEIYPKFGQQLEEQFNFAKTFQYEQGSKVFLLTPK